MTDDESKNGKRPGQKTANDIINSINQIAEELHCQADETHPKNKNERRWKLAEVFGLWAAAIVGVTAICFSNKDAADQRVTMEKQLDILKGQLKETKKLIDANVKLADAATKSAETADQRLTAERRAWIGPSGATIPALVLNEGAKILISYSNTGKEPAKVNLQFRPHIITSEELESGTAVKTIKEDETECMKINDIEPNGIVYPTVGFSNGYTASIDTSVNNASMFETFKVDQDVLDGRKIIYINGCFVYFSVGKMRHSAFCFFYQAGKTILPYLNVCELSDAD